MREFPFLKMNGILENLLKIVKNPIFGNINRLFIIKFTS